jgi:hypothetical protein
MWEKRICHVALCVVLLGATPAWATTIGPEGLPAWEGDAQTKLGWQFGNPLIPDDDPIAGWDRYLGGPPPPVWDYDEDRIAWDQPAQWYIRIPNWDSGNPYKLFWLQFVYERDQMYEGDQNQHNLDWFPCDGYADYIVQPEEFFDGAGGSLPSPDGAVYGRMTATVTMYPNPLYEDIWIGLHRHPGYNLTEVYVIAYCVPEPATLSLLAIGGALALIRRRR